MFTVEKTLRRTLRQLTVSAGFTSKQADKIVGNLRGLDAIKMSWDLYEPNNRLLTEIIPPDDWAQFKQAAGMRNKMVHGERVYGLEICKNETEEVLAALDRLKTTFDVTYGFSGWSTFARRMKPRLHLDPKVKCGG